LEDALPELLTTTEAAELLKVSRRTIVNWIGADLIPYVRLPGGDYRIPLRPLLDSLSGSYNLADDIGRRAA